MAADGGMVRGNVRACRTRGFHHLHLLDASPGLLHLATKPFRWAPEPGVIDKREERAASPLVPPCAYRRSAHAMSKRL
eukprot:4355477-Pleurochrysis_carterae.AAC.1